MITERDRAIWRAALTLANNLCAQQSDRYNDDDEIDEARSASECAKRVRAWIDATDEQLCDIFSEAWVDGAAPKVKPLVWSEHNTAPTPFGSIEIVSAPSRFGGREYWPVLQPGQRSIGDEVLWLDEAKAAAQAWYEAKIREGWE